MSKKRKLKLKTWPKVLLVILIILGFGSYYGYKKYQERKRVWIFDVVNTVILYEIVDGWSNYARYYDMSATASLGMLVFMDLK